MKQSIQSIIISFNNLASKLYTSSLKEFSESVRPISRRGNENVFMMQRAKYSDALKNRLEAEAKKFMEINPQFRKELTPVLTSRIDFYLQEFSQQCKGV